jgi:hypothetical protein
MESADTDSSLRRNEEAYFKLLELITPLIQENLTGMGMVVRCYELFSAALSHLATRKDYKDMKFCVAVSPQVLLKSVPNISKAFQK